MRWVPLLIASSIFVIDASGVAESGGERFPIRESGYWTCNKTATSSCVYWLDNDRIVFTGTKPGDVQVAQDGRQTWKYAIYIWNVGTGEISKHLDIAPERLCVTDKYVRYTYRLGAERVVVAGQFGQEARVTLPGEDQLGSGWITLFSCGQYQPLPERTLAGLKVALRKGDGFLFLGQVLTPDDRKRPITYFPEGNPLGIDLPLERWQVNAYEIKAVDFRQAYLLVGDQLFDRSDRCVPKGFARRVFRLSQDGAIREITLPAVKALRCYVEWGGIDEVQAGITVHVNTGRLQTSYLYLINRGQVSTLLRGRVSHSAVSPDGCRLAVAVSSPNDPRKPVSAEFYRGHLKVLEFCARRR